MYRVQTDEHGPWQDITEPFIVATPEPYVIDLAHHHSNKTRRVAEIMQQVQLLREFMAELDITETVGRVQGLTLNGSTSILLREQAMEQRKYKLAVRIMDNRF